MFVLLMIKSTIITKFILSVDLIRVYFLSLKLKVLFVILSVVAKFLTVFRLTSAMTLPRLRQGSLTVSRCMKLLKSRKLTKSDFPLFSFFSFVTPRLASYFGKGLNVFIIFSVILSIVFWCPVSASGVYYTNGTSFNTISNLMRIAPIWLRFESDEDNCILVDTENAFYDYNTRYLWLPNCYDYTAQKCIIKDPSYFDPATRYKPITYHSIELVSDIDYYTNGSLINTKWVSLRISYTIDGAVSGGFTGGVTNFAFSNYFAYKNMSAGVAGYYYQSREAPIGYGGYSSTGEFEFRSPDVYYLDNWNLGACCSGAYPVTSSSNGVSSTTYIVVFPVCQLSLFNAQVDEIYLEGTGFDSDVDIEEEDSCHCNCVCDCDCGYYSEELKEELIEYFETNMVTREMFDEYVENNTYVQNYYESQQEEISSIKDNTEFSSQVDDYYDNADNMFSDINEALDGLDDFESHLTLGSEIQGAGTIINSMFSNFPPSIIVAMVFVLVMLVVVKIIGR